MRLSKLPFQKLTFQTWTYLYLVDYSHILVCFWSDGSILGLCPSSVVSVVLCLCVWLNISSSRGDLTGQVGFKFLTLPRSVSHCSGYISRSCGFNCLYAPVLESPCSLTVRIFVLQSAPVKSYIFGFLCAFAPALSGSLATCRDVLTPQSLNCCVRALCTSQPDKKTAKLPSACGQTLLFTSWPEAVYIGSVKLDVGALWQVCQVSYVSDTNQRMVLSWDDVLHVLCVWSQSTVCSLLAIIVFSSAESAVVRFM